MNHNTTTPAEGRETTLDMSEDIWQEFATKTQDLVKNYLANISTRPVFPQTSAGEFAGLISSDLPEQNASIDEIVETCRSIFEGSRHTGHPRYFGYVASSASPVGAIADFIASALNQNLTAWRSSPAAAELEWMVVRWLGSLVGYGKNSFGLLTSGASMANLNALYIAHRAKAPQASSKGLWTTGKPMTVYASDQVHMSIAKAADVLGLGRDQVRLVKTDQRYRLDVEDLCERLAEDTENGFEPFAVIGSAGTVNTGAVDPLREIASVAADYNLWFHIDGAYGAFGAADPQSRGLFSGLDLADSLSLDPHKWLYAPIDCGCLLLRDPARARLAFAHGEAEYIKVYEESEKEAFAFWDYGIELTRRFRALKVWMILSYYGARHIRNVITEDVSLAKYLGERIEASRDFELLTPVELSICCFRYVPPEWRAKLSKATAGERKELTISLNELNEKLMYRVQRGGQAYLSSAVLRGEFALRVCIVNFRTTRADLDKTLDILREAAATIESHSG